MKTRGRCLTLVRLLTAALLVQSVAVAGEIVACPTRPIHLGAWPSDGVTRPVAPTFFDFTNVFDNTSQQGGAYFAGANNLVMDWGFFTEESQFAVSHAEFAYATDAPGPIELVLRLHQRATGSGDVGLAVVEIPVHNLPGSANGHLITFTGSVSFPAQNLPLGSFGWSYQAFNDRTGPLLAIPTAPGIVDKLDKYDAALVYKGSLDLGGFGVASLYFGLHGTSPSDYWINLGHDMGYDAYLLASGPLLPGSATIFHGEQFTPNAVAYAMFGSSTALLPFHGGTLVPMPQVIVPLQVDAHGHANYSFVHVAPLPSGVDIIVQIWGPDPYVPGTFVATEARKRTTP